MEWTVDYLEKDGIVIAKVSGDSTWEESRKLVEYAVALGRRKGSTRFLVDNSELSKTLSILQVDMLPKMLKDSGITCEDTIALLFDDSSPLIETHTFFRNKAFLESLHVRNFTNQKEAINWLKSDTGLPDSKSE
jgi:hypothetical protein